MKRAADTLTLAAALLDGGTAEVVGGRLLTGMPLRYLEIDGQPVEMSEPRHEAPGVRVRYVDGRVALYVTPDRERAADILAAARQLLDRLRDLGFNPNPCTCDRQDPVLIAGDGGALPYWWCAWCKHRIPDTKEER